MFKKILPIAIVFVVLLFVFIPVTDVFAQSFPGGPDGLVPCDGPECEACDLTALAQNVINFMVYFAIFVATLMFVYAGFTYVTAGSNVEKIKKAHDVFLRVFIGIVIVLSAWLVIDLIMKTFLDEGETAFGPWNKIECVEFINTGNNPGNPNAPGWYLAPIISQPPTDSEDDKIIAVSPVLGNEYTEDEARVALAEAGITINKGECPVGVRYQDVSGGCTSLQGIKKDTITGLALLKEECAKVGKQSCAIIVTGGTELGHTEGQFSHENGYKIDISSQVSRFTTGYLLEKMEEGSTFTIPDSETGDEYKYTLINEGDHWDIKIFREINSGILF